MNKDKHNKKKSTAGENETGPELYPIICELLEAGYSIELCPENKEEVKLTVVEAGEGINLKGVEVELQAWEWALCGAGIAKRLHEIKDVLTK